MPLRFSSRAKSWSNFNSKTLPDGRTRYNVWLVGLIFLSAFAFFHQSYSDSRIRHNLYRANNAIRTVGSRKVAVYDNNAFHDEVHGAILYTLRQFPDVDILFYRRPWRFLFERAIQSFWSEEPRDPQLLLDDLQDPNISSVIFTTCDWDFGPIKRQLHAEWEKRDDQHKFTVVCLRHWTSDSMTRELKSFAEWKSVGMLGLGGHVVDHLDTGLLKGMEQSASESERAGLSGLKSRIYIPSFPPDRTSTFTSPIALLPTRDKQITTALLQSTHWDEKHRAMNRTFTDLLAAMAEDPYIWGYAPPQPGSDRYTILPGYPDPFRLVFLGVTEPSVPSPLKDMVVNIHGAPYSEFYQHINAADIIIPAFGKDGYEEDRASSTVGVAATALTPILVTQDVNDLYGYFCPDFAVVRPPGVSEIEYIRRVRAGEIDWPSKQELAKRLDACREEWRLQNMETLAELITEPFRQGLRDSQFARLEAVM